MKRQLSYDGFRNLCLSIADAARDEGFTEVVATMRGGMSAAHIIAKELRLPVAVWYPGKPNDVITTVNAKPGKYLFIEDLIAEGRTYAQWRLLAARLRGAGFTVEFAPVIIDAKWAEANEKWIPKYYGMIAEDWIVFPYEDFTKMEEGDRGFFRDNTDTYGKEKESV